MELSKRAYVIVTGLAVLVVTAASLHGIADVWLWGHNGFNGAAFFNAAKNSLRFGVVGQALYHFDTKPPHPTSLYTNHPLLVHFHLIAMQWLFGAKEWAGRAVPAFYSVLDVVVLAWVTRRHWSREVSAIAVVVYALTPLNLIFANMIDHEQASIVFLLIGLDGVVTWLTTGRRGAVAQACVAFAVAAQWDWPAYPIGFFVWCVVLVRARNRGAMPFAVPFAATMLASFAAFFGWIWWMRGSLSNMKAALAMRTGAVDGLAARLWERSLDLYGPILLTLLAGWLVWTARRKREPRDVIVFAFLLGQVFHTLVFKQAGYIHAYWTWHANPGLAIAVGELVAWGFFVWGRPAYAIAAVALAVQGVFAIRQFQWGYATGAGSYAYAASDTDQREENLWAKDVARIYPRDNTRYWLSQSIYRRRIEFDIQLDAPMLAGEGYLSRLRHAQYAHEVALVDLHHLTGDAVTREALRRAMHEHAAIVWDGRFIAVDLAAEPAPTRTFARQEEPASWLWSWLHQPGAPRFHWREVETQGEPFQLETVTGEQHGGTSGAPFVWTCPTGDALLRIDVAYDGERLTALRPHCARAGGPWVGGRWVERPKGVLGALIGHPRAALPTRSLACPGGDPLRDLKVTADRTVHDLAPVCGGERVVVGLRGHYGDLVDGVAVEYAP